MRNRGRRPGSFARAEQRGGWLDLVAPLFHRMLDRIDRGLSVGAIEATLPDGTQRLIGGHADGPVAIVDLRRWRALVKLATGGSAGWYEAWAAGDWSSPDPVPLFDLFMRNRHTLGDAARSSPMSALTVKLRHWMRRNTPSRAAKNIAYHYDLGNDFYRLWLDESMTYSSGLFADVGVSLEEAQTAKLDAILARTATTPGDSILEIGCGWGSFAKTAHAAGRQVHGITLSTEQRDFAAARLPDARFTITDYRAVTDTYDAVVSIEMAEAVGRDYWPDYARTIARALKPGGRAALQIITIDDAIFDSYAAGVDFIQAYVFPGGMLLSEREFRRIAAAEGLSWQDEHRFGLDYAETLRLWRERFDAAVAAGQLPADFGRDFIDLWRYYLMYCEGGFRGGGIDVLQVTLVKDGA
ncbi:class I SAM-dependent methyltransferase [Sphingomonas sp. RS2018]